MLHIRKPIKVRRSFFTQTRSPTRNGRFSSSAMACRIYFVKNIDQIIKKPDKVDKFIMPAFVGANPWSEDDSIPVMSHATSALKDTWKRRPSVVGAP